MRTLVTSRRSRGFTLIELMIVVSIVTVLAMIAIPSYNSQIRKSRRSEAKSALLDLAAREERFMSTTGAYTDKGTQLGYPQDGWSQNLASGFYKVDVTNVNAGTAGTATTAGTPATFTVTATAIGAQQNDTQCLTLVVDQTGAQTSTGTGGTGSTGCW
jgi:type IV pilus assembly protein PilE